MTNVTIDQPRTRAPIGLGGKPMPGLLLLFSNRKPMLEAIQLGRDALEIGRGHAGDIPLEDNAVSRRHAEVSRSSNAWKIRDLESRNGTFVDGKRVSSEASGENLRVLRVGGSIFSLCADVRPFWGRLVEVSERRVTGPQMVAVFESAGRAASSGNLHITGESGAGKELVAREFHLRGPRPKGPFVAVNCAAIVPGIAERLLFGARKGAYSGASEDAEGYLRAADCGTLFLDEVGELSLEIQAKLLRVLETREVMALGATKPVPVDIRVCSATLRDVRALVAEKKFREDLYFRIARPHVTLPPLRERPEEIPYLVGEALHQVDPDLAARPSLIEACLVRQWPGNVRELLTEIQHAAKEALAAGRDSVEEADLSPSAGLHFERPQAATTELETTPGEDVSMPEREIILDALRREDGNVARTARALGIHRSRLRRWLDKENVDPKAFAGDDADE